MGFSIKELEAISGIKAHTIRIWEQRYHFLKPSRTATNIRTYSNEELKTLLNVALLNRYGYKISLIDEMEPEQRQKAVLGLDSEQARDEYLVNELITFMIDLDPLGFEVVLNEYIKVHGLEPTITRLIFNFLEKVGILWQTDRINPAQEHIVTNIIRQKLICGIEHLAMPNRKEPTFLLFLPEGDFHEIGLLYVYYLLKKKGIPVIYLGSNVPLKDLDFIVQIKKPEYLYLHLTIIPRGVKFDRLLQQLTTYSATTVFSGNLSLSLADKQKARFLRSLPEVIGFIEKI